MKSKILNACTIAAISLLAANDSYGQAWTNSGPDLVTDPNTNFVGIKTNTPAHELTVNGDIGYEQAGHARSIIGNTSASLGIYSKGANWNDGSAILLNAGTSATDPGLASFFSTAQGGNLAFRFTDGSWNHLFTINALGDVESKGNYSFAQSAFPRSISGNTSNSLGIYSKGVNWTDGSAILLNAGNGPSAGEGLASFFSTAQGGNLAFRFTDGSWNHLFAINALGDVESRGNYSFSQSGFPKSIVGNTSASLGIYSKGANWNEGSAILLNAGTSGTEAGLASFFSTAPTGNLAFRFTDKNWNPLMTIAADGQVAIGSVPTVNTSQYKLYVQTGILTEKIKVALSSDPNNWSDFVFNDDYELRSLNEVETYIKENKHLPEIPSTEEVHANGLDLAQMDAKLLQKIEELTLYIIQQQKEIDELKGRLNK